MKFVLFKVIVYRKQLFLSCLDIFVKNRRKYMYTINIKISVCYNCKYLYLVVHLFFFYFHFRFFKNLLVIIK